MCLGNYITLSISSPSAHFQNYTSLTQCPGSTTHPRTFTSLYTVSDPIIVNQNGSSSFEVIGIGTTTVPVVLSTLYESVPMVGILLEAIVSFMALQQTTETYMSSSLENDVLLEYERLVSNIDRLNQTITRLNTTDVLVLIDRLRALEKKVGLVYTLFKASVYSLVTADQ
ncbi:20802_t:CDS:2 [Dentiscutata erythropus]|uniref:DASH complex subunit DAD3 n=1 Tax=Dentiscutata erythropus TaxID=1348616 RepID=A0A9N8VMZ8_9GLOM|nr:20802_t:CDS:2 [Dentiscutata erythropus]